MGPSRAASKASMRKASTVIAFVLGAPSSASRHALPTYAPVSVSVTTTPPGQAPSWKSTDKDRYFLCGLVVKTGCSHHEIFGAQPLQISSMFRARIILGSFWARVHGRCGVPVVLHGPKSCWLKNYCDHNVHVICKNVTKNIPSIPLREPSCT